MSLSVLTQLPFEAGGIAYLEQGPFAFLQRCCLKPSRASGIKYFSSLTPGQWRARRKQCRGLRSSWWSWRFRLQIGRRTSRLPWAPPNSTIWIPGSLLLGKFCPGRCWREPLLPLCAVPQVVDKGCGWEQCPRAQRDRALWPSLTC